MDDEDDPEGEVENVQDNVAEENDTSGDSVTDPQLLAYSDDSVDDEDDLADAEGSEGEMKLKISKDPSVKQFNQVIKKGLNRSKNK